MLGFVNDSGRMNAMMSENAQHFFMNAFASDDCFPNGGFPNDIIFFVVDGGVHSRKFVSTIPGALGSMSIPITSAFFGALRMNAPLPADGSTHRYFAASIWVLGFSVLTISQTHCAATASVV
jgi:hypothetical protein